MGLGLRFERVAAQTVAGETAARGGEHGAAGGGETALGLAGPPRINPPPVGSGSSTDMARRLAAGGLGLGLGPGLGPGLGLAVGLAAPLGLRSRGLAGERRRADRATGGVSSRGLEPASETADGEERRGSDAKTGLGGGEPAQWLRPLQGESRLLGLIGGLEALAAAASAEGGGGRSGLRAMSPPAAPAGAVHCSRCSSPLASCCVSGRANHVA